MTPVPALTQAPATAAPVRSDERAKLVDAARQFEAIFLRQIMAAARKTDFGGTVMDNQAMGTFRQMQDENFADIAAKTGTFGLAQQIEAQLAGRLSAPAGS